MPEMDYSAWDEPGRKIINPEFPGYEIPGD
jgi:hypothetical protein